MSSLNSLMKYRFQKKEDEKFSSQNSQSSDSTQEFEPYKTKQPQSPNDSQSPVFSSKRTLARDKQAIILSDSEEEEPKAKPEKSSFAAFYGSSPWLSKERMINGGKSSSGSKSFLSANDREFQSNLRNLQDMFPDVSRDRLEEALVFVDGNIETAIDRVIAQKSCLISPGNSRKRNYAILQTSPRFSGAKKARCEDDHYNDIQKTEAKRELQNGKILDPYVIQRRISLLGEMFPSVSKEVLELKLKEKNYDVEKTTVELSSYSSAEPVSQTQNVGSIKAFFASRALAKSSSNASASHAYDDKPSKKTGKTRLIVLDESESEDDAEISRDSNQTESHSTNEPILNFFNDATVDELTTISGCSRKKAELIEKLRPFRDFSDLVSKFEKNSKTLPYYLITECKEVIKLRNSVRALMEKCQRISVELGNFVADLAGKTMMEEDDNDLGYIVKQPGLLSSEMKLAPYQLVGLNWLILMHSQNINGILGDEMGLGKTIQTIAFFAHLLEENDLGPHLIICPSSTIDNWLRELKTWCPALKVLLYYGNQEERREIRNLVFEGEMEEFNVVVTTYNMASGSSEDRVLFKKLRYHYAVFDEGHMLKNMTSIRYQSLLKIQAERRLLLTGTPLQNNLVELMSLLSFVMPEMFINKTENFKKIFAGSKGTATYSNDSRGSYERETVEHAKQILKPFFLRRLKSEVLQQLPGKTESTMRVPMAFEQQELYDELRTQFVRDVSANKDASIKGQSGSSMMMQLRKAANHQLLHRRHFGDDRLRQMAKLMLQEPTHKAANVDYVFEDMQVMSDFELHRLCETYQSLQPFCLGEDEINDSGKFRYLDELLPNLKSKGDRILLFSQFTMMLDVIEFFMKSRDHQFLRLDGSTPVAERQEMIDEFNSNPDIFVFLLSTKAGGLGINLTAANVVILHDIDFNPYNDKQAEDRCHRLGQCRDVTIYRLVSKNTIEEAMLRCAQAKLRLERDVTGIKDDDDEESNDVASLLSEALLMKEQD